MKRPGLPTRLVLMLISSTGASFFGTSLGIALRLEGSEPMPEVGWYCLAVSAVLFLMRGVLGLAELVAASYPEEKL